MLRAAHQLFDGEPRILDDPVVVTLMGAEVIEGMRERRDNFFTDGALALRSHVVTRNRYAEDRLAEAVRRGIGQYVMLGAGGDTFALRQPAWARDVRIFEADHPASQAAKRSRIRDAGLMEPDNLTYAAIDFEVVALRDGLAANGVDLSAPVFFSWLGVSPYLTESANDAVFRTVAALPSSSEIVFTFAPPSAVPGASELAQRAAEVGEPFLSYYTVEQLAQKLGELGFGTVEFLSTSEARARYFAQRTDSLPAPRRTTIGSAIA